MDNEKPPNSERPLRLSPKLLSRARQMRDEPTPAEQKLWACLRDRRLAGLKFRRQVPFGNYIADFYCPSAKLIVELDGDSHEGRENYDRVRTEWFEGREVRVIRFTNEEVNREVEAVMEEIARVCGIEV